MTKADTVILYDKNYGSIPKIERANELDAEYALYAFNVTKNGEHIYSDMEEDSWHHTIPPMCRELVATGIRLVIPPGHEGQIRPRSSLALNNGVTVLNSPGTIDSGYRGEVSVVLINLSHEQLIIKRGVKIAQLVFAPNILMDLVEYPKTKDDFLKEFATERSEKGFGSSGA